MPLKKIIRRYEPDQYIALDLAHPYEGYLIFPAHFIIDIISTISWTSTKTSKTLNGHYQATISTNEPAVDDVEDCHG